MDRHIHKQKNTGPFPPSKKIGEEKGKSKNFEITDEEKKWGVSALLYYKSELSTHEYIKEPLDFVVNLKPLQDLYRHIQYSARWPNSRNFFFSFFLGPNAVSVYTSLS